VYRVPTSNSKVLITRKDGQGNRQPGWRRRGNLRHRQFCSQPQGAFSVSARRPRTGRNPKTGETIEISASRSAKFKAGKQLKDSLNEETAPAETVTAG
jgi:Bacterial DNA-binding protein